VPIHSKEPRVSSLVSEVQKGDGWAVAHVDALGEGPGIRKVRRELDVTAFGVNVIVMPPRYRSTTHSHEAQEEVYFVFRGELTMEFGDGAKHTLPAGGLARVDASTVRHIRNETEEETAFICFGGKDGYVGRDGVPAGQSPGPLD
jgi:mannose-6-phosphate isomerase-like protein (cupin superfamily)